jgi:hypothetical protein
VPTSAAAPSIGEQGVGHQFVGIAAVLKMQTAEFYGAGQNHGRRVGIDPSLRCAQGVQHSVAAHESHVESAHGRRDPQTFDEEDVQAGSEKPVQETVTRCVIAFGGRAAWPVFYSMFSDLLSSPGVRETQFRRGTMRNFPKEGVPNR